MTTGLRERKKAATRRALHAAAVRLAVEHGIEHLTVEAIADAATVSRRTFSNYFASKEQALLYRDRARMTRLLELVRARPERETPVTAFTRAVEELVAERDAEPEVERYRELRRHPALLTEMAAVHAAAEQGLAGALAHRLPTEPADPLRARVLAAVFLAALRVAGQEALDHRDTDFVPLIHRAITMTREGFR
ncbi:TetR family transcriptional regulator [Streptomyces sp. NPDC050704]|uniref:TetR/AcrR family transcriptional regulator n=1 Tax=Streptomyces sp. NPDC050704 TaxID=3157219 RepID=UPI00342E17CA